MLEHTVSLLRRLVGLPPMSDAGSAEDRRGSERYRTDVEITYRPEGDEPTTGLCGRVRNVSRGGIQFVVARRFDPGDLLRVELPAIEGRPPQSILACVVHVAPLPCGEWSLGCNFSCELADAELAALGRGRRRAAVPSAS